MNSKQNKEYRIEKDFLGEVQIPKNALYGIQTLRAFENFSITKMQIGQFFFFRKAFGQVKKATALVNIETNQLDPVIGNAIVKATDEIIAGKHKESLIVDPIQGGAGTSSNMNINEVLANRALEILGKEKGDYKTISPNNHVNLSQSTNDVYPTALRISLYHYAAKISRVIRYLELAFLRKAQEFKDVVKVGRTQLQDAVPMTLGQEFHAFATTIAEDISRLQEVQKLLLEVNIGATAIGTGINASDEYRKKIVAQLSLICKLNLTTTADLIEATSDAGVFVQLSSVYKRLAIKLNKIANDLRLLNSGPHAGLGEINLPQIQPGSSIMPGKVNPVIPEMINQLAYEIIGNDLTITLAASNGQLQLNAFEPVMAFGLFRNSIMLSRGVKIFVKKGVKNITANKDRCLNLVINSNALATALTPFLGYEQTSSLVKQADKQGIPIYRLAVNKKLITEQQLEIILKSINL